MNRNDFLKLCQQNAKYPKSVKVKSEGIIYYPYALKICFNNSGETLNLAILKDTKANSITYADVKEVEEL